MHRSLMAELERGSSSHSRAGLSVVRGKAQGMAEASIFLELNLELPGCL